MNFDELDKMGNDLTLTLPAKRPTLDDATNWTADYPTKRGFYWIRNYSILGKSETIGRSERTIAYVEKVRDGLSFWLFQWPDIFSRGQVMAAEWQGPIEPTGS